MKFIIKFFAIFFCLTSFSLANDYQTFTLKNGLEVYIIKTASPIVNTAVVYRVGSRQEKSGKEGIAHYLEHSMFLGTNKYSKKDFSDIIKETGAYYNAFTSYDITLYYLNLPARHLKKAIKLEADRMKWLTLDEKDIENEKQVINQENKMYQNNVYSVFYDVLRQTAYPTTNYGRSLIGYETNFNKLTKKDLKDFYDQWYVPNNARLFIIGNVDFDETKKIVTTYFGRLPSSRKIPERTKKIEEVYKSNIFLDFKDDRITQPIIVKSYLVPSWASDETIGKKDSYSLMMLENLLSSNSGKMYKYLVIDKKVLLDFSVSYKDDQRGSTSIVFTLVPSANISQEEALKELDYILDKTMKEGFKHIDLKINANLIKDSIELLKEKDMEYMFMLARYINAGLSYDEIQKLPNNVALISNEDVINVYDKYIKTSNYVVAIAKNN